VLNKHNTVFARSGPLYVLVFPWTHPSPERKRYLDRFRIFCKSFFRTAVFYSDFNFDQSSLSAFPGAYMSEIRQISIVQFTWSRNPVIIDNKCDIVESRRYRH